MQNPVNEFRCILCENTDTPDQTESSVKGDEAGILAVVRCPSCGHLQLFPPSYDLGYYDEDGQINAVIKNYGTQMKTLLDHAWVSGLLPTNGN
jgi:hypothetical protein